MRMRQLLVIVLFMSGILVSGYAQNLINIGIGPTWPKDLRDTDKPTAWNATIEYGKLFDNVVGFGVDLDFSWNVVVDDTSYMIDTILITQNEHERKQFMFPISIFLLVDPMPKFVVHPVVKAQVGLNMMTKTEKVYDALGNESKKDDSGFYIGIIGKASIDAVWDFGEHAALFAGFEYQWGRLRKKIKGTDNLYYKPKFHGPGIRMGLSFLF